MDLCIFIGYASFDISSSTSGYYLLITALILSTVVVQQCNTEGKPGKRKYFRKNLQYANLTCNNLYQNKRSDSEMNYDVAHKQIN